MYTEAFGRSAYLVSRSRGKKSMVTKALFMPLASLEMEVEHLNKRDLNRIREARLCYPITELFCNPIKNVLGLFLSEVLFRVVRERESDMHLFAYLYDSIRLLELTDKGVANFHIVFLLKLLHYLGIFPNEESYTINSYFDMMNGVFVGSLPSHDYYLNKEESSFFVKLLKINFENMSLYSFSRQERVNVINHILDYYRLHLPEFPEIKSLSVMQSLFD
jgi:DNA repair protein RecO (recombination protein O)